MEPPNNDRVIMAIQVIALMILTYIVAMGMVQRYKCPELTETELLLRLDDAVVWRWVEC